MSRPSKTSPGRTRGRKVPQYEGSPAANAIARIRTATEKALRNEANAQATREQARARLVKSGALPGSPRTFD